MKTVFKNETYLKQKLLDLTVEELLALSELFPEEPPLTSFADVRKLFQQSKHYGKKVDFDTLSENGCYLKDPVAEAMRIGYLQALKETRKRIVKMSVRRKIPDSSTGTFIIGRRSPDGGMFFSRKPYSHSTLLEAQREASRLSEGLPGVFVAYQKTSVKARSRLEWKDKPKKEKTLSLEETLIELQNIIEKIDITEHNVPVGIGFFTSGKMTVKWSYGDPTIVESPKEAIAIIQNWINDFNRR